MDWKTIISVLIPLLLLASTVKAQSGGTFDVTKYGGAGDIQQALTSAWKEACASTSPSKVLIPKGIHALGLVSLSGPCKAPIELRVEGTLKSPVEPGELKGDGWVTFENVDQFTLSGGGIFDGQGKIAWEKNNCNKDPKCDIFPMNFRFNFITNGIVQDITSQDSKNFHVNVLGCKNLTFQHFTISAPGDSLNTDGIHIGRSNGVNIIDSKIATGDDCISLGDGSQQINVERVTCGPGHGISVGSLGRYENEEPVSGVFVKNCTLSNTSNGVRIKSWPGLQGGSASTMHFEDIIMNNVSNPVLIDQMYCPWNQCTKEAPSKVKISDVSFKKIRGTSATPIAVQLLCSTGIPCEKVELADIDLTYSGTQGPAKSECANVKPTIIGTFNPPGC